MRHTVHLLALGLAVTPVAGIAAEPVRLAPAGKWAVSYNDDSCRLTRVFGSGEQATALIFERFAPGPKFTLMVAGAPLQGIKSERVLFQFGPGKPQLVRFVKVGALPGYQPALVVPAMRLADEEDEKPGAPASLTQPATPLARLDADERAIAKGISWLSVKAGFLDKFVLDLGAMDEPMGALQACASELITHWGIDAARHADLSRPATPANSQSGWIANRDYALGLRREGIEGLVHFRLMVDANGAPTSCHIQSSTRPREFDDLICNNLMRKARFKPALDAKGQPIASYFRSTARFDLPN
ncbi:MAG: TonB family protein [Cypionkella sp.]